MNEYDAPELTVVGSVHELTLSFDKVGSTADVYTPAIPQLDGDIKPG